MIPYYLIELASKGIMASRAIGQVTQGVNMSNGIGSIPILGNIATLIAQLIPGEQPWLGELAGGGQGPLGALGAGLASIIPGYQPFLGEVQRPPVAFVKSWSTGTITMFLLQNGKIGCYKKNGVWKEWRPARHIVVPRNPRIGTLISADKRIDRLMRGMQRRLPASRRRRTTRQGALTQGDIQQVVRLLSAAK
jgi:hypothetical protein